MAKKAAPKKEAPKPKEKKTLKRRLAIPGFGTYPAGTEVTSAIEKEYLDFYKKATGGDVRRPLDWYC